MAKEKGQLFCYLRRKWISASPEEVVRQDLLRKMIEELGYPFSCISIERDLRSFPHLQEIKCSVPNRRFDIVCFGKGIHPSHDLFPLLVVECKANAITSAATQQLIGYNYYIRSPYLAVSSPQEILFGWYDLKAEEYVFKNGLPLYQALLELTKL